MPEQNDFPILLYHKGVKAEDNFVYRHNVTFQFAPRFTVELSEPIVILNSRSHISMKLTNNSRDGVADSIRLQGPFIKTATQRFHLKDKGSTEVKDLICVADSSLPPGDYVIQVEIGGVPFINIPGRKIDVRIDTSRSVGILTKNKNSPIVRTLRKLNMYPHIISDSKSNRMADYDVLILDTHSQEFFKDYLSNESQKQEFFDSGGHFIILSQIDIIWNHNPLIQGVRLERTFSLDEEINVNIVSQDPAMAGPNRITTEDLNRGWISAKSYNEIFITQSNDLLIHADISESRLPLLVSKPVANGHITYLGLYLDHQLLYIHPGALRLISNLISSK
jgi:hypothetical protein